MRKLTALIAFALAALLLAAACGDGGEPAATPTPTLTPTAVAMPTPEAPPSPTSEPTAATLTIEVTEDVAYTSAQTLDIYAPSEPGPWPVVVILHGMGAGFGNPRLGYTPLAEAIAEQGALVFNATWTVSPVSRGAFEDGACAVRFARATAADYGGDPNLITLLGHSAGAYLGSVTALAGDDFEGDCLVSGVSALPDVFVGVAGAYDPAITDLRVLANDPDLYEAINPSTHIGRNPDLRVRLLHGDIDDIIPVDQSVQFQQALEDAGYDVTLNVLEGVGHDSPIAPTFDAFQVTVQEVLKAARD